MNREHLTQATTSFREWYEESYPTRTPPHDADLKPGQPEAQALLARLEQALAAGEYDPQ